MTPKTHTPISIRIAGHFFCIFLVWVWIPILNYNIQEGRVCKPQSLCIFNNLSHILNSFFAFTVPCLSRVQPNKCWHSWLSLINNEQAVWKHSGSTEAGPCSAACMLLPIKDLRPASKGALGKTFWQGLCWHDIFIESAFHLLHNNNCLHIL